MPTSAAEISIRNIETIPDMRQVEALQKEIWGVEDREVFPALALKPMTEVGGILIGAFDDDRMVGFVFGFPGLEHGRVILHSDMLAVKSDYRSRGLGYALKLAQREKALEKGVDTITWTFDPLQSLNAHLNFTKLGVTADRYLVNYYGDTTSFLHRTGTDRLWVTWLLSSDRVKTRLKTSSNLSGVKDDWEQSPAILRVGPDGEPVGFNWPFDSVGVIVEIPAEINSEGASKLDLEGRWRQATREAFKKAVDADLVVEEFRRFERDGRQLGAYLARTKKTD